LILSLDTTNTAKYILWTMAFLFGLSCIFLFWNSINQNPKIIIDDEGIWADTFPAPEKKVLWKDILGLEVNHPNVIELKLEDEGKLLSNAKLSRFHKLFPHLTFRLFFTLTDVSMKKLSLLLSES